VRPGRGCGPEADAKLPEDVPDLTQSGVRRRVGLGDDLSTVRVMDAAREARGGVVIGASRTPLNFGLRQLRPGKKVGTRSVLAAAT
jgi:hypothetical protein